ncbi:hypothetical protein [uncultured Sphingomonas sp.]|uniref:hypothetical protein n=1 Tax=uncultured Sphingomonas sp. TaxID=158754 RepID=UPI0035CC6864
MLRVVQVDEEPIEGLLTRYLAFERMPVDHAWVARAFRKAVHDDRPASADFHLTSQQHDQVPA